MGMIVQHNMNAINAYNRLNANVAGLRKASEKLASGYRINRAGDDAAGLAVSEKMRSQIKGLNQAVRNSQDGINMIQTYEGAAQETHSILQRMKELATQSANGTYDNATDRAAIQLEFDQLNDELNQIADTDFNGTVVLNGGVMADGTVAKDGEFRYANGYTETVVAANATDISDKQAHTIADQTNYNKEIADAVWKAVGADVTKNQTLDVTFMYDGERWVADTVTDGNGNVVKGARASGLGVEEMNINDNSGNGGFKVIAGKEPTTGNNIYATNAIFDEMEGPVKKGDTLTIRFENSKETTYAPKNAGIDECKDAETGKPFLMDDGNDADSTLTAEALTGKVGFTLSDKVTDAAMSQKMENVLSALDQLDFDVEYDAGAMKEIKVNADSLAAITDTDVKAAAAKITIDGSKVVYDAGTANEMVLGTFKTDTIEVNVPEHMETKYQITTNSVLTKSADKGNDYIKFDATSDTAKDTLLKALDGKLATDMTGIKIVTTHASNGTVKVVAVGGTQDGQAILTGVKLDALGGAYDGSTDGDLDTCLPIALTLTNSTSKVAEATTADPDASGKFTIGVNIDAFNYADMSNLSVHAVATPKVATMASQVAEPNVSVADSFKNSTGVLTYAENLTLQTGARTKDSVNFAFSYNQDGTADMGNLVANLDLSSRSTGLNTANLSLANQKDANYAIDQIDKAINKTSMVRATFGSIQNRLEHKITNLTTTAENLTEAESSIRDTDMASEMMNYTKFNILQQAAQSMLAQANQQPQSILQLLG